MPRLAGARRSSALGVWLLLLVALAVAIALDYFLIIDWLPEMPGLYGE